MVNTKNANTFTGKQGKESLDIIAKNLSRILTLKESKSEKGTTETVRTKDLIFASTGVIGEQFPVDKIKDALPDLVEKLIVVDILPVSYNKSYDLIFDSLLNINLKQIKSRNEFNLHLKKYFDDHGFILFLSKNLKRSLDGSFEYKSNIKVLRKTYSNVTSSIYFHKEYRKEVLFIKGENSDYIDSENLKITSKLFPKYKLTEIKNAGHWIHHENPDDFFSICLNYL